MKFLLDQAIVDKIPIVGIDEIFDLYSVERLW